MNSNDSRTAILHACYRLMLAKGYSAAGVDEICRAAGMSKGSFYHFFESKQACALAMLDQHMAEAQAVFERSLDVAGLDPVAAALAYVEQFERLSGELLGDGCLIGSFALELAETHPELRERVSGIFHGMTADFARVLAPLAGKGPAGPTAEELAEQMLLVIEGGVVLSKAHREGRFVAQGLRLFRQYLETLRPAPAAKRPRSRRTGS